MRIRKMRIRLVVTAGVLVFLGASFTIAARAEDGHDAWLRYGVLDSAAAKAYASVPRVVIVEGDSPVLRSAQEELTRGLHGMLRFSLALRDSSASAASQTPVIVLATEKNLAPESFRIRWSGI